LNSLQKWSLVEWSLLAEGFGDCCGACCLAEPCFFLEIKEKSDLKFI
jgi:hypothetical protein